MAKTVARRSGTTPLKGRPLDDDGAIAFGDPVGAMLGADEDEQLAANVGKTIILFVRDLAAFFTTAKALETAALATLEQAKQLTLPKSGEEDERLQRFIKKTSADKQQVGDHWRITALISQFHRRMTSRRAKSVDALDQANRIGNDLHNRYCEQERRRAAEAQERLDREAEAKAQQERDAELFRMETEALKREAASPELSEREGLFVDYITGPYSGNGQRAAQQAGYKNPQQSASTLLASPKIQKAIKAKQEAKAIRDQAAARRVEALDPYYVPEIKPDVSKAAGASDRTTHSAELIDEQKLIAAVISGGLGIPWDILTVKPAKLNEYARSLHERINLWPGVRYKKDTKVI